MVGRKHLKEKRTRRGRQPPHHAPSQAIRRRHKPSTCPATYGTTRTDPVPRAAGQHGECEPQAWSLRGTARARPAVHQWGRAPGVRQSGVARAKGDAPLGIGRPSATAPERSGHRASPAHALSTRTEPTIATANHHPASQAQRSAPRVTAAARVDAQRSHRPLPHPRSPPPSRIPAPFTREKYGCRSGRGPGRQPLANRASAEPGGDLARAAPPSYAISMLDK